MAFSRGASVPNQGEVRFADAPAGRGTELRVELRFEPPAGVVGKTAAAWLGDDAEAMVREALRRYKQVLETGEVLRSEQSARRRPRARREASGPTRRSGGGVMKAACWMGKGNVELHDLWSLCENSNPNAALAETMMGHAGSGAFGYSHLTGGFAGGQAQYARVPFADVGPLKVESALSDEQVLFLSDILPTGDSQRPVPRPPLHAPAPRAARTRRNRPVVRSSPTGYR